MPISVHRIALGSDYTQVVDKVQKKKSVLPFARPFKGKQS